MANEEKMPREGTTARVVVERLRAQPDGAPFTVILGWYREETARRHGTTVAYERTRHGANQTGMTLSAILHRYAHKTGPAGSKAPWKFGPKPSMGISPELLPSIESSFYVSQRTKLLQEHLTKLQADLEESLEHDRKMGRATALLQSCPDDMLTFVILAAQERRLSKGT